MLLYENYIPQNQRKEAVKKIKDIASLLDINPNDIMIVIFAESRFSTTVKNSIGCVGIIQFCPDRAGGANKTIGGKVYSLLDIQKMTWVQQLELSYQFWKPYKNYIFDLYDLYLATFYPLALRKDDKFIFGIEVSDARARSIASQNPAISKGHKYITKPIFRDYIKRQLLLAGVPEKDISSKSNLRVFRKFVNRNTVPIVILGGAFIASGIYIIVNRNKI